MSQLLTASSPAASTSRLEREKNEAVCSYALFCRKQDNAHEYLSELTLGQVLRKKIDPCKIEEQICF